jgi:hypothetical protein
MVRKLLTILSLCVCAALVLAAGSSILSHAPVMFVHSSGTSLEQPQVSSIDETDMLLIFETFEGTTTDWTTVDLTAQKTWHKDDFNHYGPSGMSWWVGDSLLGGYDNEWLQYLVSPTLNLASASNAVLEFDAFWALEAPPPPPIDPHYNGYDGGNVWISGNNGVTWSVLPVQTPAYNYSSLGSFGYTWNMYAPPQYSGVPIAGWAGYSGNLRPGAWVHCTATIPSQYNVSTVKIRMALASDEEICTHDSSVYTGFFVDNLYLHQGATTYLQNDADGLATPSDMNAVAGDSVGNLWHIAVVTNPPPPTATHVMRLGNGSEQYVGRMKDALVSPRIDLTGLLPNAHHVTADFYIRGSLNVGDPDTVTSGLDYWTVQVSPDSGRNWYYYSNPYNQGDSNAVAVDAPLNYMLFSQITGNKINLSAYLGHVINLRILFESNDDAFTGSGLFVDNIVVEDQLIATHDAGASNLWIPMPTSVYMDSLHASVEVHNFGASTEPVIPIYLNSAVVYPMIPFPANVPPGGMVLKTVKFPTPAAGSYNTTAYTQLTGDTSHSNDLARAGIVEITPANVLEFGYDNRQYSYSGFTYWFTYAVNNGACVKFTPQADGIYVPLNATQLKAKFHNTGTVRVHLYYPGTVNSPGSEITNFDVNVTNVYPDWQTISLSGVTALQNANTDFWVWFEVTNIALDPALYGAPTVHGQGHYFTKNTSAVTATGWDFFVRADLLPLLGVENPGQTILPTVFNLGQNSPNPFNPATVIPYALPHTAQVKLSVFDVGGRLVSTLVEGSQSAGQHQVTFNGSNLSSGLYFYTLSAGDFTAAGKMLLLK